jgi:hypothetical protein
MKEVGLEEIIHQELKVAKDLDEKIDLKAIDSTVIEKEGRINDLFRGIDRIVLEKISHVEVAD